MRTLTIVGLTCLALCGCEDKPAQKPAPEGAAKTSARAAKQAVESTGEAAKTMVEVAKGDKKAWEVKLAGSGLPDASGPSVFTSSMGPAGLMYKLFGTDSTANIMLRGVEKGATGTFKPDNFSVLYPKKKIQCGATTVGKGKDAATVTLKVEKAGTGLKGTIEGEVTCRNVDGSGEPKTAKVSGWFED